jgi:hypothetical protein
MTDTWRSVADRARSPLRRGRIAVILALALATSPALAQQKGAPAQAAQPALCNPFSPALGCRWPDGTINQKQDGAAQANPLANLTDDVMRKLLADFTYAAALADAAGNTVTAPCWHAWVDILTKQQQPLADGKGNPLTKPDAHVVTDAEYLSEFINQLQPNSPLSLACAPALQASQKSIATLVGAVLSGGALNLFKLP